MGAAYELKFTKGYPPTINDESVSQIVRSCAEKVVGEERVLVPDPTMGGEDMSFFYKRQKGVFMPWVSEGKGSPASIIPNLILTKMLCRSGLKPIVGSLLHYLAVEPFYSKLM